MEITRGKDSVKSLIPMLNKVFRVNFPKLLPKLYTSEKYAPDHYVCRIDGKLAGAVASIKNTLTFSNGSQLSCAGVSGVAVKKKYRGRGIMNAMMTTIMADAKAENIDFMYLNGKRKRYERYGFVPSGYCAYFTVNSHNVRLSPTPPEITFLRYIKAVHEEELIKIYNSQSCHYDREEFDKVIKSWKTSKYKITVVIYDSKTVGYIVCKGFNIVEIMLNDIDASEVICAYYKYKKKPILFINTYCMNTEIIKSLSNLAEKSSLITNANFAVLNYWNVIEKILNASPNGLDYEYVLEIEGEGKKLIKEADSVVTVTDTEREANLILAREEATSALFCPTTASAYNLPFTLKLSIPIQDNV